MTDDATKQRILARRAQLVAAALSAVGTSMAACEPSVRPAQTVIIGPTGDASVEPMVLAQDAGASPSLVATQDSGAPPLVAENEDDAGPPPMPCLSPVPCLSPPRPCLSPPPRPCLKPSPPPRVCLSPAF